MGEWFSNNTWYGIANLGADNNISTNETMRYIKRGTLNIVQAQRVEHLVYLAKNNWQKTPEWFLKAQQDGKLIIKNESVYLSTLHFGVVRADEGDWILYNGTDWLTPVDDNFFQTNYKFLTPVNA